MTRRLALLGSCLFLLVVSIVSAQGTATGTFTVKGKPTYQFAQAYAFWKVPWNDRAKRNLHVLLSDIPIAPEAIPSTDGGIAKMAELTRTHKVHALELVFAGNDTTKLDEAEQGAVYHNDIAPARMGVSGPIRVEQIANDGKVLKGRVDFDPKLALSGYSAEATFEVAIPPPK